MSDVSALFGRALNGEHAPEAPPEPPHVHWQPHSPRRQSRPMAVQHVRAARRVRGQQD